MLKKWTAINDYRPDTSISARGFVGSLHKRPSYDWLITCQWLLGFLRFRQEKQDPIVKENMVEYLTELLHDACYYSWEAAKGAHCVLLHRMQDGVVSWQNLKEVNKICKRYAHTSSTQSATGSKGKVSKVVQCFKFNKGRGIMSGRICC